MNNITAFTSQYPWLYKIHCAVWDFSVPIVKAFDQMTCYHEYDEYGWMKVKRFITQPFAIQIKRCKRCKKSMYLNRDTRKWRPIKEILDATDHDRIERISDTEAHRLNYP